MPELTDHEIRQAIAELARAISRLARAVKWADRDLRNERGMIDEHARIAASIAAGEATRPADPMPPAETGG